MTKYFITGLGRSGTTWLSSVLDQARDHECRHEEMDTRSKVIPQPWTPFPVERWAGKRSYGEVNGMLRYHLSAQSLGREMEIPKRAYLRRDPLKIIASWMSQARRLESELSATCHEVLWHANNLAGWAKLSGSRIIDVEDLWSDVAEVQRLADWLCLDVRVTPKMMAPANAGSQSWQWKPDDFATLYRAADRVGYTFTGGNKF